MVPINKQVADLAAKHGWSVERELAWQAEQEDHHEVLLEGIHQARAASRERELMSVHGNKEVVNLLREKWREAKEGSWSHVAIVVVSGDDIGLFSAGSPFSMEQAKTGLDNFSSRFKGILEGKRSGASGEDAGLHEYNLATDSMNFDFLVWLIEAEMIRREHAVPGPLRVRFKNIDALSESGMRFFTNVNRPLLHLIPAVETSDEGGWRKAVMTSNEIVRRAHKGQEVPVLHADRQAREQVDGWLLGKPDPVTITLREAKHTKNRNSDIDTWLRFASDKLKDHYVIFVRDTAKASEPLTDKFDTYPSASLNVRVRMALYERAKVNLFVSNGPSAMAIFSDRPYLLFCPLDKDEVNYAPSNPSWWVHYQGISEGEQWPWARPGQRMIWKHPTYENLCEAWDELWRRTISLEELL